MRTAIRHESGAPRTIALWSHPRSMSTSVERSFRERGDCRCHHEPFMYYHYLVKTGTPYPGFEPEDNRPREIPEITAMLTDTTAGHVFFKDMSYYIVDELDTLMPFMEKLASVFLIRDPRRSLASYAKLDPGFTLEEGGLEAQWNHYAALRDANLPTLIIEAESIARDPESAMGRIWDFAELPAMGEALSWNPESPPEDWEQTRAWHAHSLKSTGFAPPDSNDADAVFAAAASAMPRLEEYLAHHLPYYERLKSACRAQ